MKPIHKKAPHRTVGVLCEKDRRFGRELISDYSNGMSIKQAKGYKKKCDDLFSKIIRSPGTCLRCGSSTNLQCAHIISRRYNATRTDTRNAWSLCATCHFRLTNWPREHSHFITQTIGSELYDELKLKAETVTKMDWQLEYDRLKEVATCL